MMRTCIAIFVLTILFLTQPGPESGTFDLVLPKIEKSLADKHAPNPWFYRQRSYPYDEVKVDLYHQELGKVARLQSMAQEKRSTSWVQEGPYNIGGRITDIEVTATGALYVGSASGGVFHSQDQGQSWTPLLDAFGAQPIGDIALALSNPDIIYVGTGEPNGGGGSQTYPGMGVLKSVDAGQSWLPVGLSQSRYIGRIQVDPNDADLLYVAVLGGLFSSGEARGIYRSKDGGLNWEQVLFVSETAGAIDVIVNPEQPNILYASFWDRIRNENDLFYSGPGSGLYRSQDKGDTWEKMTQGLPVNSGNHSRIGLALSKSHSNILYAYYSQNNGEFLGIYRSDDGGLNWQVFTTAGIDPNEVPLGDWCGKIYIHPTDPDYVYLPNLQFYVKRPNSVWTEYHDYVTEIFGFDQAHSSFPWVHVDHHAMAFHPEDPTLIYLGNDGGLYRSQGAFLFEPLKNMPNNQLYAATISPGNGETLFAGMQDNGTWSRFPQNSDWTEWLGGDGFHTAIDPRDESHIIMEAQFGNIFEFINYAQIWHHLAADFPGSDRRNWNTPISFDPNDGNIFYYGAQRLYRRTGPYPTIFEAISPDLSKQNGTGQERYPWGTITTFDVAESDSRVIYAGTDDGNVWVTQNGGEAWQLINQGLPNRWVTRVVADPIDAAIVYVTLSGFRYEDYQPHVLRSDSFGSNWVDISGNLPEVPCNDLVVHSLDTQVLVVATDLGVFVSKQGGHVWSLLGRDLPSCPVNDLDYHAPSGKMIAATYGRSLFSINLDEALLDEQSNNSLSELAVVAAINDRDGGTTLIKIINNHDRDSQLVVEAFDAKGGYLGQITTPPQVPAMGSHTIKFQDVPAAIAAETASVQVKSSERLDVLSEWLDPLNWAAAWAGTSLADQHYVPHVAKRTEQFQTFIASVNAGTTGANAQLIDPDGSNHQLLDHFLPNGQSHEDVRHFLGTNLANVNFLSISSSMPQLASLEYFVRLPGENQLAMIDLVGETSQQLQFLHIATDLDQFWSGLVYINVGSESDMVMERYYAASGELLLERAVDVTANGKITRLFDLHSMAEFPVGSAWLDVTSSQPLIGYELFGASTQSEHTFFAGLNANNQFKANLLMPLNSAGPNQWTGLAFLNGGSETIDVQIELIDDQGQIVATASLSDLAPKAKVVRLLSDLFPSGETGSWIKTTTSQASLAGFVLWGDLAGPRQHLAGLRAR